METHGDGNSPEDPSSRPAVDGLRVTLDWLEILDSLDVDTVGEFSFAFSVVSDRRGLLSKLRYPEGGTVEISENPAKNRVSLGAVLYEGPVRPDETLVVEGRGEEVDRLTPNDRLDTYRREFSGDPADWIGRYGPWDENAEYGEDPESLEQWRIGYHIDAVAVAATGEPTRTAGGATESE